MTETTEITSQELSDYFFNNSTEEVAAKVEKWFYYHGHTEAAETLLKSLWDSIEVSSTAESVAQTRESFEAFCKRLEASGEIQSKESDSGRRIDFRRIFIRAAAILFLPLLILSVYQYVRGNRAGSIEWTETLVAYGQKENVTLPDGSIVTMNSGSRIVYPNHFVGKTRQVIFSGEGYFSVSSDASRPFVVKTGNQQVKVLGTEFNLKAYSDEDRVEVKLLEGKVAFGYPSGEDKSEMSEVYLVPGSRLEYDKVTGILKQSTFDHINYTSWKDGHFYFKNTSLEDIVKQLERSFDTDIMIVTDSLKTIPYYMAFVNNESLDDILSIIDNDPNIKVVRKGNIIEIY